MARTRAQFGKSKSGYDTSGSRVYQGKSQLSVADSIERIAYELKRFGVPDDEVIISTNIRLNLSGLPYSSRGEPSDPGVAIYWKLKGRNQCMAVDRYDRVADNLAAIAATLEAMRSIERHGGGSILERAFIGFAQLSAAIVTQRPWREVLKFTPDYRPTVDQVQDHFRKISYDVHPDREGGSHEAMTELNAARAAALAEIGR
jgi:hypothetical protein